MRANKLLGLPLFLGLLSFFPFEEGVARTLEDVKARGKLIVGVKTDYPMSMRNSWISGLALRQESSGCYLSLRSDGSSGAKIADQERYWVLRKTEEPKKSIHRYEVRYANQ